MEQIPKLFNVPCLINMAPRTPSVPAETLERMGYAVAIYPAVCLAATIRANMEALEQMKQAGRPADFGDFLAAFMQFNQFLGVPEYNELEQKYKAQ
jgi:2-methylisocitrate lyase-like PEP mutase family enzyme